MSPRTIVGSLAMTLGLAGCSGGAGSTFPGYVEGEFVYLASSQPGTLQHLAVVRGQEVAAGAALFTLEAILEQAEQHQAHEQLAVAEAQLKDLETGKRPPEIAVVSAQLAQAEAAARRSTQQRERDEAQFRAGGISQEQLQASVATADSDAARVRELANQVAVARLPGRAQQLTALASQVQAARAALAAADWRLAQKTVVAPRGGLVFDTLYREGEWIAPGNPVVRLLPPENIKVRFFVPETVVGKLATGTPASLHCDGCTADIPATVSFISPEAEYTPPVIYSNETRGKLVYLVEARPSPQDAPKLHPGQPLAVRLK